jgi:hypothetical protein
MDILQGADLGTLLIASVILVGLCVAGLLLMFGLQLLGTLAGLLEVFTGFFTGGPIAGCGCVVLLVICVGVAAIAWLVTTCSANPNAMNFCLLVPR